MGDLAERTRLSLLVHGNGIPDNFKNNSVFLYQKYQQTDDLVKNIPIKNVKPGSFYFFHYKDDSNWMKWAPVFVASYKKFSNKIILFCVNFNFIPLELRVALFDKFITEEDFDKDRPLKVDYNGMYEELKKLGFEYALMEFNSIQLVLVHRINLQILPRFFFSQHPKNTYDPKKLLTIWESKISSKEQRHQELMLSNISEWYDINKELTDKYDTLYNHVKRIRNSQIKYGR
jgi:hypothetical protein